MKQPYKRRGVDHPAYGLGSSKPTPATEAQKGRMLKFDDIDDFRFQRHFSPEARLIAEVLACACRDFLGFATVRPAERETARAWLFDGDVGLEPFTYSTACGLLGIDPERGRADILAQAQRRMVG